MDEDSKPANAVDTTMHADEALIPVRFKSWALVKDGFVVAMKRGAFHLLHPFEDVPDDHDVINVTGVPCAVGYLVDNKGNVAPAEGREEPLMAHEPAYHDRANPPAAHIATMSAQLQGSEPHAILKAGADQPDGKQDNRGTDTPVDKQDQKDKGQPVADAKPKPVV